MYYIRDAKKSKVLGESKTRPWLEDGIDVRDNFIDKTVF